MIGCANLWIDERIAVSPELNRRRALIVLGKIDEILAWEQTKEHERDERFVELGQYLCEVRAGQYWRLENLKSFDEFLEKRFPESRRKAYYLLAIHEHLARVPKRQLREVGWTKARELVKVARRDGTEFDCAPWVHKARELPKEEFKREVEKYLTGKAIEPWEIVYFKLYKGQLTVVESALEISALMLGSNKSRGYSLEMICADFLAGLHWKVVNLNQLSNLCHPGVAHLKRPGCTIPQRAIEMSRSIPLKRSRIRKSPKQYARLRTVILKRDGWRCQICGCLKNLDVHHLSMRSALGDDAETNMITLCRECHRILHRPDSSRTLSAD